MIKVEFLSGPERGRIEVLDVIPFVIGRSSECHVQVDPEGHLEVSGKHAEVRETDGGYEIEDLSRNGTFVNGSKIEKTSPLSNHATIELGRGGPRVKFSYDDTVVGFALRKKRPGDPTAATKETAETRAYDPKKLEADEPGGHKGLARVLLVVLAAAILAAAAAAFFLLRS